MKEFKTNKMTRALAWVLALVFVATTLSVAPAVAAKGSANDGPVRAGQRDDGPQRSGGDAGNIGGRKYHFESVHEGGGDRVTYGGSGTLEQNHAEEKRTHLSIAQIYFSLLSFTLWSR